MTSESGPERAQAKHRRNWWQFSLRTLLVVVALLCVLFAWMGAKFNRVRQQRQAIAELKERGFVVLLDYEEHLISPSGLVEPPGPKFLRNWLGDDFFDEVISASSDVSLDSDGSARELTDDDLKLLGRFPQLTYLSLAGDIRITDKQLALLAELSQLQYLSLDGCPVTDSGMAHIARLRQLSFLDLSGTSITDAGLAQLGGLANLHELRIARTGVTELGIQRLRALLPKSDINQFDSRPR